jgi:hypothetical protein
MNIFTGGLVLAVALYSAFGAEPDRFSVLAAAQFLLFAFTYLWVGINRFLDVDGHGLGWYCLFVALTAAPIAFTTLTGAGPVWLGLDWAAWAVLWFVYWLLLALGMTRLLRFSGVASPRWRGRSRRSVPPSDVARRREGPSGRESSATRCE